jgi:hypothetical protein
VSKNMPSQAQRHPGVAAHSQQGAVLIIVLIMLALLSMSAATSLHQAQSTESISGSSRNTELASQAADIALRCCEDYVNQVEVKRCDIRITDPQIIPFANTPIWKTGAAKWDAPNTQILVAPLSRLGNTALYKRAPECLMEFTKDEPSFCEVVITARGFGPEVAPAGPQRLRPVGTEVWLQAQVTLVINSPPPTTPAVKSRTWRQIFLR